MRFTYYLLAALILLTSCNDAPIVVTDSAGKTNNILLIIEDDLWENEVGDKLRELLAAPVDALVREEPEFTLNQIKPAAFGGLIKKTRSYLKVELSNKPAGVTVANGLYANPQTGVLIRASSNAGLIEQLKENSDHIKKVFNTSEIEEKQRLMKNTQLDITVVKERLGIEFIAPRSYRYAAAKDKDFFWLRRDIREGTMDIMIYEVPRAAIPQDSNIVASIIKIRDSVGSRKVPVDKGKFVTTRDFSPFVNESSINDNFAYETKGLWEVTEAFMSGPFLNYAIYNKERDNWLIIEGYIFAPSAKHRNYLFELEAILKSVKFVDKKE